MKSMLKHSIMMVLVLAVTLPFQVLPFARAEHPGSFGSSLEIQTDTELPPWLFATNTFMLDDEEVVFSLRMRVFEENDFTSGLWEVTQEDAFIRISRWGASIENDSFAYERDYFAGEEFLVTLTGEVVSPEEVQGTFSYMGNEVEFTAVPLDEESESADDSAEASTTITGVLFSANYAAPVADATILDTDADGETIAEVTTDENGRFTFEDVEVGVHNLQVEMALERAYDYCPNSTGMIFGYFDIYPGISDAGAAITGTTADGRGIYSLGVIYATVESEGDQAEVYINADCQ